jgi:hypothetical protein
MTRDEAIKNQLDAINKVNDARAAYEMHYRKTGEDNDALYSAWQNAQLAARTTYADLMKYAPMS